MLTLSDMSSGDLSSLVVPTLTATVNIDWDFLVDTTAGSNLPGVGGELQLTDAIGLLLESEPVFGRVFTHGRYDIGQKLDFLRANIEIALDRPDLGPGLADYLRTLVRERLS